MQVNELTFPKAEAEKLLRRYKEHRAWSAPADPDIERIANLIAKGKLLVRGVGSVISAGLKPDEQLPKLAIARADGEFCHLHSAASGRAVMTIAQWIDGRTAHSRYFEMPNGSFPGIKAGSFRAVVPHMPPDVRPARGLENYHILFEAEWKQEYPVDPILCRQIGKTDFFVVLAQWDLTEIERAVLSSRLGRN